MSNIVVGVVLLTLFLVIVYALSRNVLLGWYCLLASGAINDALGDNQALLANLHIDPIDLTLLCLTAAGVLRFLSEIKKPSNARLIAIPYLLFLTASLLRGVAAYGIAPAGNQGRAFIGEAIGMLYFFTIPTDQETIKQFIKALLWSGLYVVVIGCYHYAVANVDSTGRPLGASTAQIILICFFFSLGWLVRRSGGRLHKWLTVLFGSMVILLQHRTVWIAAAACIGFMLLIDLKLVRRLLPSLVIMGALAAIFAVAVFGSQGAASDRFEDSATNSGTFEWRLETWQQSLEDEDRTITTLLVGNPMGSVSLHYESGTGSYSGLAPHSEYVGEYLKVGVLGTLLLVAYMSRSMVLLALRQRRAPLSLFPSPSTWAIVILGIMVYGGGYSYDSVIFAFVGVGNALLLAPEEEIDPGLEDDAPPLSSDLQHPPRLWRDFDEGNTHSQRI